MNRTLILYLADLSQSVYVASVIFCSALAIAGFYFVIELRNKKAAIAFWVAAAIFAVLSILTPSKETILAFQL